MSAMSFKFTSIILFVQKLVMDDINEKNLKLPTTDPLWGETTAIQWNPAQGPAMWETSCYDGMCDYIPVKFHSNILKII